VTVGRKDRYDYCSCDRWLPPEGSKKRQEHFNSAHHIAHVAKGQELTKKRQVELESAGWVNTSQDLNINPWTHALEATLGFRLVKVIEIYDHMGDKAFATYMDPELCSLIKTWHLAHTPVTKIGEHYIRSEPRLSDSGGQRQVTYLARIIECMRGLREWRQTDRDRLEKARALATEATMREEQNK
jgi:hypothetical protein